MKTFKKLMLAFMMLMAVQLAEAKIKIGVTLHPYYSFVANIVKDKAEVVPIIPEGFNPHAYEPRAQDIKRINDLDVVVVNGIGHDSFADKMIAASENKNVKIIHANKDVPLLSAMGMDDNNRSGVVNSHTFISFSAALIQVTTIANELAKIDPANADFYQKNARAYNKKIRKMRTEALKEIKDLDKSSLKVATVHAGYDYLLRDFGLNVSAVVEPAHGIEPSPTQLKKVVEKIKSKGVDILFAEKDNPSPYTRTIAEEAHIPIAHLTHMTHGPYTPQAYEEGMKYNVEELVKAMKTSQKK